MARVNMFAASFNLIMDDITFNKKAAELHALHDEVMYASYDPDPKIKPGGDFSREWVVNTHIPMGIAFMVDMFPYIVKCVHSVPGELSVIDVGCARGSGTELLATFLRGEKRKIVVNGCDILRVYARPNKAFNRNMNYMEIGLEKLADKTHDIVICSHMLEHYKDPFPLIKKLQQVAKKYVVILVPFNEPIGTYSGHHFCFTKEIVLSLKPVEHFFETPITRSVCFVLPAT